MLSYRNVEKDTMIEEIAGLPEGTLGFKLQLDFGCLPELAVPE